MAHESVYAKEVAFFGLAFGSHALGGIGNGVLGSAAAPTSSPTTTSAVGPNPIAPQLSGQVLLYVMLLMPFLPFVTRGILWVIYRSVVTTPLKPEARDEESHRSASLTIGGFAITIFAGLIVVDHTLEFPIYFAGMSFIAYLAAFLIQGDKHNLLIDQIGDAAMDSGSLCLVVGMLALLKPSASSGAATFILLGTAVCVWVLHHTYRWITTREYMSDLRRQKNGKR